MTTIVLVRKNNDVVVAGGMENMSLAPYYAMNARKGKAFGHDSFIDSIVHDGLYDPYNNFLMGNQIIPIINAKIDISIPREANIIPPPIPGPK